jgi:type II secretory pathway predicted ATPase ExeA
MYAPFFGFTRLPFDQKLNADQLFRAPALDELHSRLGFLIETRGIGLLTGEPGSGKSTALRRLRDSLHPEKVRTVYLHDTAVNPADFFRQLALGLGIEPHWSRALVLRSVQQEITRLVNDRHLTVLLVIDEADHLRPDLLALLPLLTNFDWDGQNHLALLLAGQSGLRNKLRLAHLEPLAQRITVRYALPRLDRAATRLYLEHRLRLAGVDRPLFDEPALESLFAASGGLMRQVDSLAHHALAAAALSRARLVDADHVLRAAEETRA